MNRERVETGWKTRRTIELIQSVTVTGVLLTATTAAATGAPPPVQMIKVPLIEWDLPMTVDMQPGAMVVDTQGHDKNRVWFVTRLGTAGGPRVYRFDPPRSLLKGPATWTAWQLGETEVPGFSGGLMKMRASHDRRYVFVRTNASLQRVDTQNCSGGTCALTMWLDQLGPNVSDVAIDDQNHVFTTAAVGPDPNDFALINPAASYLQMLTPGAAPASDGTSTTTVKRWQVGGGAGFCDPTSIATPCISGIAVHPTNRNLVYYSEGGGIDPLSLLPFGNNIGELNIATNKVRRWSLSALGLDVSEPRQLHVDRSGKVWVVTGSGHLVSLDPCTNKMTRHTIPLSALNDPFGIAPDDDVVGYTATGTDKVGMMHPKGLPIYVCPTEQTICPTTPTVTVKGDRSAVESGCKSPVRVVVDGTVTKNADGTFVEAMLASGTRFESPQTPSDSMMPLGISPNRGKAEGTFFYAVGSNAHVANRIGFVRLQLKEKIKHPRDDDDPDDGYDDGHNHDGPDGHHGHEHHRHGEAEYDDDDFDNQYDTPAHENLNTADDMTLAGGQTVEYPVTASSNSLALIATAIATNPLAQIGISIYDPAGLFVASSAPTPGAALASVLLPRPGNYTMKVRNYGLTPVVATPTTIVREPWEP